MRLASRPGFAAALVALMLLLHLAAVRVLFTADREHVAVAGMPFGSACSFRQHFGIPCPACGMTRSVVLTLHGDLATASDLNPGGPAGIFGIVYFIGALLWLGVRQLRWPERAEHTKRRIQWCGLAIALLLIAVVSVHWIREIAPH